MFSHVACVGLEVQGQVSPVTGIEDTSEVLITSVQQGQLRPVTGLEDTSEVFITSVQRGQVSPVTGLEDTSEVLITSVQQGHVRPVTGLEDTSEVLIIMMPGWFSQPFHKVFIIVSCKVSFDGIYLFHMIPCCILGPARVYQ